MPINSSKFKIKNSKLWKYFIDKKFLTGFTLIELLVVISIISILGIVVFANFKNFAQDQAINKAIGQIQTALRVSQTNATTGVLCIVGCPNPNVACGDWWVEFSASTSQINLYCTKGSSVQKNYPLENAIISFIEGDSPSCSGPSDSATARVTYSALYGLLVFSGSDSCFSSSSTLRLSIWNPKSKNTKTFNISKGGAVDVQ